MDDPKSEYLAGALWMAECCWHFLGGCSLLSGCHSLRWTTRYRKSHFHCPCPRLCHASFLHGLAWVKQFAGEALIQGRKEKVLSKHWFTQKIDQLLFRKKWLSLRGDELMVFPFSQKNYTRLVHSLKSWSYMCVQLSKFSLLKMFTARITLLPV